MPTVVEGKTPLTCGVSDGIRTRDFQDHNLVLYQLNYTHHGHEPPSVGGNERRRRY